jgi:hypothetical protein
LFRDDSDAGGVRFLPVRSPPPLKVANPSSAPHPQSLGDGRGMWVERCMFEDFLLADLA